VGEPEREPAWSSRWILKPDVYRGATVHESTVSYSSEEGVTAINELFF
jgi:hypothetical protein